ncbi:MAG: acetate--CoA ligase family protein [Candidatus Pacearchaeota archaeon]|nr:acetate--CoA ligase family protein [Candidatus Pacearchaeota archaeon]
MAEMLDLESSFEELKDLPIAEYLVLPINSSIDKFQDKILKLKFPLWLKLNSWEHKASLGGIELCLNQEDLDKKLKQFQKKFQGKKFILQKNISGIELIAGLKQDKTFGKVLLLGAGGSFTEILQDKTFLILPSSKEKIETSIKQLKIFQIIEKKSHDLTKLINLIYNFSQLKIQEADLNPIILNDKEAVIVDARVVPEDE